MGTAEIIIKAGVKGTKAMPPVIYSNVHSVRFALPEDISLEEADLYGAFLPPTFHGSPYPLQVGDLIALGCSKTPEVGEDSLPKVRWHNFRVTKVESTLEYRAYRFGPVNIWFTVYTVEPIKEE